MSPAFNSGGGKAWRPMATPAKGRRWSSNSRPPPPPRLALMLARAARPPLSISPAQGARQATTPSHVATAKPCRSISPPIPPVRSLSNASGILRRHEAGRAGLQRATMLHLRRARTGPARAAGTHVRATSLDRHPGARRAAKRCGAKRRPGASGSKKPRWCLSAHGLSGGATACWFGV